MPDDRPNPKKKFLKVDHLPGNAKRPKQGSRQSHIYGTEEGGFEAINEHGQVSSLGGEGGSRFSFFAKGNDGTILVDAGQSATLTTWNPTVGASAYSGGAVTVTSSGMYAINCRAQTPDPAGAFYTALTVKINGEQFFDIARGDQFPAGKFSGTIFVPLTAGDVVAMDADNGSESSANFGATEFDTFSIVQIA